MPNRSRADGSAVEHLCRPHLLPRFRGNSVVGLSIEPVAVTRQNVKLEVVLESRHCVCDAAQRPACLKAGQVVIGQHEDSGFRHVCQLVFRSTMVTTRSCNRREALNSAAILERNVSGEYCGKAPCIKVQIRLAIASAVVSLASQFGSTCLTTSGKAPTGVANTGRPQANASSAIKPKHSSSAVG